MPLDRDAVAALSDLVGPSGVDATPEGETLDATQATMALLRAAMRRDWRARRDSNPRPLPSESKKDPF